MHRKAIYWVLIAIFCFGLVDSADAKRRSKHRRRAYKGPPPTHPVVLWARTLSESTDREQRKIAAFKLSQYSQPIYQTQVIDTMVKCMKDTDVEIKVLCAKAMAHAGTQGNTEAIRKILLETYNADPELRQTIVRAFIVRRDAGPPVHDTFLDALKKSSNPEETLTLLGYFEQFGHGTNKFAETLVDIYKKSDNTKVKRSVVKALGERAHGQDAVVEILAGCADSKDTPMALTCLSGLQNQAKKDQRAWVAVEKSIESGDPDVLTATLDVINALPEQSNPKISTRLVEIIRDTDDADIDEKAALALGVCGDGSEPTVKALSTLVEEADTDDSVRIAAALVLGKQAVSFPEKASGILTKCASEAKSQSLRTACQLGNKELETRRKLSAQAPKPTAASAATPAARATNEDPPKDAKEPAAPPKEAAVPAPASVPTTGTAAASPAPGAEAPETAQKN